MSLVPGGVRESYWQYITFSKESFTRTLVWISRKTTFVITVDDSIDLEKVVVRDAHGSFKAFKFPTRTIWLSNHQVSGLSLYRIDMLTYCRCTWTGSSLGSSSISRTCTEVSHFATLLVHAS